MKDDLVQDMIDVLTNFYARLYGRSSAKNRAKKALMWTSHIQDFKNIFLQTKVCA